MTVYKYEGDELAPQLYEHTRATTNFPLDRFRGNDVAELKKAILDAMATIEAYQVFPDHVKMVLVKDTLTVAAHTSEAFHPDVPRKIVGIAVRKVCSVCGRLVPESLHHSGSWVAEPVKTKWYQFWKRPPFAGKAFTQSRAPECPVETVRSLSSS